MVKIHGVIGVLILIYSGLSVANLTSKELSTIKLLEDSFPAVLQEKPQPFLDALRTVKSEAMALNRAGFGLTSSTLDNAAKKIEEIGIALSNAMKLKKALDKKSDINALSDKLRDLDKQLSTVKQSISKSFFTQERTQAKDYLLKAIEVVEMLADDAIASVSRL